MKRSLFGAVALAAFAVTAVLIGTASAAKPPHAARLSGEQGENLKDSLKIGA